MFTVGVEYCSGTLLNCPEVADVLAGVCLKWSDLDDIKAKTLLFVYTQVGT